MKETQGWIEYCKTLAPAIVETCAKVAVSSGPGALGKALSAFTPDSNEATGTVDVLITLN